MHVHMYLCSIYMFFVAVFVFKLQIYLCSVQMLFDTYFALNLMVNTVSKNMSRRACES